MAERDRVPHGWRVAKLGELGEVGRGRSRHRPRYAEHLYGGPYPFIQTADVKNSDGRITRYQQTYSEAGLAQSRMWPEGTMCITIAANIAETGILTFPACFPDSIVGFVADESKCDTRFVEYTFRVLRKRIQHEASGSVQDNINLETLDRLRFALPPLAEQQAIAGILGTLDEKIDLNRRMNETLEAMAQALFKSWFVDFDPVHAMLDGRDPGLPQALASLFPTSIEDSELGEIPCGWRYVQLGDPQYFPLVTPGGFTDATERKHYVATGDVIQNRIVGDTIAALNALPSRANMRPGFGRVWFAKMKESPKHLWTMAEDDDWWSRRVLSTGFAGLESVSRDLEALLYCFISSAEFNQRKDALATGTTMQAVNNETIRRIGLVIPTLPVAKLFGDLVRSPYRQWWTLEREALTLGALRDALLPALLSGELRLKDAGRLLRGSTHEA